LGDGDHIHVRCHGDDGARDLVKMGVAVPELKQYMDKKLRLKLNGNRGVVGILRGFDQFLNLVLDEATSDNGDEEPLGMVVVRGNSVTAMEALEHIPAAVRKA